MNEGRVVKEAMKYVKQEMPVEGTGHDWFHAYRVWRTAVRIAKTEKDADLFVVQLAALFHDISDWKFNGGDLNGGSRKAKEWLEKQGVDRRTISAVSGIIFHTQFESVWSKRRNLSLECRIVQDADSLDAMGAVGIARLFAYGGHKNRPIHDPSIKPKMHKTFAYYKSNGKNETSVNHFYEKALLLKSRMLTKEGRKMASKRDAFMKAYLKEFLGEWDGEY
jgi:uncharacterized protein